MTISRAEPDRRPITAAGPRWSASASTGKPRALSEDAAKFLHPPRRRAVEMPARKIAVLRVWFPTAAQPSHDTRNLSPLQRLMPSHYEDSLQHDIDRIRKKITEMGMLAESA